MPIVVVGALLGGILLLALSPELTQRQVNYAAVLSIALLTNVRINKQIEEWSVQTHLLTGLRFARWVKFHILRTLFSVPALANYITSILLSVR